jgi:hypothetical protein
MATQGSKNKDKNKPADEEPDDDAGEGGGEDGAGAADDDGPPAGYGHVTPQQGRQNWWVIKPGAVVQGRLLGAFDRKGKDAGKKFLQLRLAKSSKAVIKGGEEVTVPVNGTINLDVKKGLQDVVALAADGGVYDLWIKAVEKVDIGDNKTFWRYDVRKKVIKAPLARAEAKEEEADEDVPF